MPMIVYLIFDASFIESQIFSSPTLNWQVKLASFVISTLNRTFNTAKGNKIWSDLFHGKHSKWKGPPESIFFRNSRATKFIITKWFTTLLTRLRPINKCVHRRGIPHCSIPFGHRFTHIRVTYFTCTTIRKWVTLMCVNLRPNGTV